METPAAVVAAAEKCPHYGRRCHVLAECCKQWVGCRLCHDDKFGEQHQIDRFAIRQMRCDLCQTEQPECSNCHENMAAYFCSVCNLFDDKGPEKKVFHCDQCGICRVGGRENYYHCVKCCGCYPHSLEAKHKCLEGSMHRECPICLDVTFDSLESVNVLPCGHVMHASCFKAYVKHHNIECPTCRTLMFSEDEINGEGEDGEEGEDNEEGDTEGEEEEDGSDDDDDDDDDDDSSSSEEEGEEGVVVQVVAGDEDDSDSEPDVAHDAERNVWPGVHRP